MKRIAIAFALLSLSCASGAPAPDDHSDGEPTIVYLVRHAEKASGQDPGLNQEGKRRARALARLLSDVQLDAIYSTDYRRTRETAKPVQDGRSLRVEYYDPTELREFADRLREKHRSGSVLVVGHSNTTPQLIEFLGGNAGGPIDEATEYDRLYLVVISGERVTTQLLRYAP